MRWAALASLMISLSSACFAAAIPSQAARMVKVEYVSPAPPGAPVDGQIFLVDPQGAGTWGGHGDQWATWRSGSWSFEAPAGGDWTYEKSTGRVLSYSLVDGAWTAAGADANPTLLPLSSDTVLTAESLKNRGHVLILLQGSIANLSLPEVTTMAPARSGKADIIWLANYSGHTVTVITTGGGNIGSSASLVLTDGSSSRVSPVDTSGGVGAPGSVSQWIVL